MTDKLKQVIEREIVKLPIETQEAINAVDWGNITEQIGKEHLLDEIQLNDFQVQTLLILLGLRDAGFYETYIENEVGTTKAEVEKISEKVFEKIFDPIAKLVEENIRKNMTIKKASWEQNVDFIMSGGSYFAFITPTQNNSYQNTTEERTNTLIGSANMQTIKRKLID